jgi:GT2 family glycosyltransferase
LNKYPLVSIIIVNYNGEKYLDKLFESLQHQTFKDFEIILVDNASKDNSLNIVHKYTESISIKIITNNKNLGFCLANNQAIQLCSGKYIIFLNNDTYLDYQWLEMLIEKAKCNKKACAIVSLIQQLSPFGVKEGPSQYDIYGAADGISENHFFYGTGASLFVRKDLLNDIGNFDPKLFMYQDDVDLCWRIRLLGYDIFYEPKSICYHLKNSKGRLNDNLQMTLWKFFHAHCKNRLRLLIKNYSKTNVVRRLPIALALILIRSLFLSFVRRNPKYILCLVNGIFWNLYNLSDTLTMRHRVQGFRKENDSEIIKFMLPYSVELLYVGRILSLYVRAK